MTPGWAAHVWLALGAGLALAAAASPINWSRGARFVAPTIWPRLKTIVGKPDKSHEATANLLIGPAAVTPGHGPSGREPDKHLGKVRIALEAPRSRRACENNRPPAARNSFDDGAPPPMNGERLASAATVVRKLASECAKRARGRRAGRTTQPPAAFRGPEGPSGCQLREHQRAIAQDGGDGRRLRRRPGRMSSARRERRAIVRASELADGSRGARIGQGERRDGRSGRYLKVERKRRVRQVVLEPAPHWQVELAGDDQKADSELLELLAQFYAHTRILSRQVELRRERPHERVVSPIETGARAGEEEDNEEESKQGNQSASEKKKSKKKIEAPEVEGPGAASMVQGASDEELMHWLSTRKAEFGSLNRLKVELVRERPNSTFNVCPDGPKILISPNVNEVHYCYTHDQWVEKLWLGLQLSAFHYPIILLNVLIFLVGTTGNIFVCLSVKRNHQLRSVTNYFIVNLAFADFLVILICLPATVVWDLSLTWFFDTIPCKLIMFLQDVSISVSVLTLTAISIDRYYAICHPLKFKSNLRQAKRVIALIWLVSLLIMTPDLLYLQATASEEFRAAGIHTVLYSDCNHAWSTSAARAFQFVKTILLYLLPFLLMFCAHYRILRVLRLASSMAAADQGAGEAAYYQLSVPRAAAAPLLAEREASPAAAASVDELRALHLRDYHHRLLVSLASERPEGEAAAVGSEPAGGKAHSLPASTSSLLEPGPLVAANAAHEHHEHHEHPQQQQRRRRSREDLRQVRFGQDAPVARPVCDQKQQQQVDYLKRQRMLQELLLDSFEQQQQQQQRASRTAATRGRARLKLLLPGRWRRPTAARGQPGRAAPKPRPHEPLELETKTNVTLLEPDGADPEPPSGGDRAHPEAGAKRPSAAAAHTTTSFQQAPPTPPAPFGADKSANVFILTMHNKSKLESRQKAAKMLTAIVVLFGICYLPVHLINFLRQFIEDIPQTDVTSTLSMLAHCVCYLNSAINPIIYNHMNSVFRAEFRKFLSCLDWRQGRPARAAGGPRASTTKHNNNANGNNNANPNHTPAVARCQQGPARRAN